MKRNLLITFSLLSNLAFAGPLANLNMTPTSHAFGAHLLGTTAAQGISVKNISLLKSATSVSITGASGPFSITGNSCGATLLAGKTCGFTVAFKPTTTGSFTNVVHLNYFNGASAVSVPLSLSGNGVAPPSPALLKISDAPTYNYGGVKVGSVADHIFTVANSGGKPATAVVLSASAPYSIQGSSCGGTISAGSTCTVTVRFKPILLAAAPSSFKINYFNGMVPTSSLRGVTGIGTSAALSALALNPSGLFNFGVVQLGHSADQIFTLKNNGLGGATGISLIVPAPFALVSNGCGLALPAGGACSFSVRFAPAVFGTVGNTLVVNYSDVSGPKVLSLKLKGRGASPAFVQWNAVSSDFGSVPSGASFTRVFSLINTGGGPAQLSNFNVSSPFYLSGGSCWKFLPPGASCSVTVVFAPVAAGVTSGILSVNYFDGSNSQLATLNLFGAGLDPALLALSGGPSLEFGSTAAGQAVSKTLTLSNIGQSDATLTSITVGAPFSVDSNDCGTVLSQGSSCSLSISFNPTSGGDASDAVIVQYQSGRETKVVSRAVHGLGAQDIALRFAEGTSYDFGQVATGSELDRAVTVMNPGQTAITGMQPPSVASPFAVESTDCTDTLQPGASCSISVDFSPTSVGEVSADLTVASDLGVATLSLKGIGTDSGN